MKTTQNERIKAALEAGRKLTPLEALNEFGCLRLASRIADLRKMGLPIVATTKKDEATGKSFAQYYIAKKEN